MTTGNDSLANGNAETLINVAADAIYTITEVRASPVPRSAAASGEVDSVEELRHFPLNYFYNRKKT